MQPRLCFRFRDFFIPRRKVLEEAGIKPGFRVLDYGCGSGSYIPDTSEMVGPSGKVYALDINPVALEMVRSLASIRTPDKHRNYTFCVRYHVFPTQALMQSFSMIRAILLTNRKLSSVKLHRALKTDGVLSLRDHRMREDEIIEKVGLRKRLCRLKRKGRRTYLFRKNGN